MVSRLLLIYAVVELAAVVALVSTVGWGWTLLVLLGTFLLGWGLLAPMAGSQLIRQIRQLRSGPAERRDALGDGALVTLATALVLIPGVVTTVLGLLLLVPPIRSLSRPALAAVGMRGLRRVPLINRDRETDYIDGEVLDVRDFEAPALRSEARGGFPGHPGWD